MRETISQSGEFRLPDAYPSIPAAFFGLAADRPDAIVYSQARLGPRAGRRDWIARSYAQVSRRILAIAHYLSGIGFGRGAKAAVLSNTRPEWMEAEIAIQCAGGVSVSIYPSAPAAEAGFMLFDSGAEIVFAENQEQVDKLRGLLESAIHVPALEDRAAQQARLSLRRIVCFEACGAWKELVVPFSEIVDRPGAVPAFPPCQDLTPADIAALVYTSGASGVPKGVLQSHGNHLANVRQGIRAGILPVESSLLLFLPLAHSFARLIGYIGFLTPALVKFPAIVDRHSSRVDFESYLADIRAGEANILPVVPKVLERMESRLAARAAALNPGGVILRAALWAAAQARLKRGGLAGRLISCAGAVVCRRIRRRLFGRSLRYVMCGGAKLPQHTALFFERLGVEVLEGYGLTEACVGTHINRPGRRKSGTAGQAVASDLETRIAPDGEILLRGPNIAQGYHNRPRAAAAAWDEAGWLHTGDLGRLDPQGFLTVYGRKADMLTTSNGENISPEALEQSVCRLPSVSHCLVCGDGRPHLTALVSPRPVFWREWFAARGRACPSNLAQTGEVYRHIWEEIQRLNRGQAPYMAVRRIALVDREFTVENGLLTPSLKLKRAAIAARFRAEIDGLYGADSPASGSGTR